MHLAMFTYNTFRRHAWMYLEPTIIHKWGKDQEALLHQLSQDDKVIIGGDMRADSPGIKCYFVSLIVLFLLYLFWNINVLYSYVSFCLLAFPSGHSAKYGSYSVMHLQENKIIDIQLVQVSVKYTRMTVVIVTVNFVDVVVMFQSNCDRNNTIHSV